MHRAFRPLRQIEDTAAAIADGDLTRRIPTRTAKDEVTSLSRSLNVMLAQIEQSFAAREASEERMRQFVADASHELRTPLAAVRGYAELYRQGAVREPADVASAMSRIEGEASRMGGLVEDLLMLARLDDQRPLQIVHVDLTRAGGRRRPGRPRHRTGLAPSPSIGLDGPLAPTVACRRRGQAAPGRGQPACPTPSTTPRRGPRSRSPWALADRTATAVLEVRDHGPGVDPEKARKVFERFYRADPSRVRGQWRWQRPRAGHRRGHRRRPPRADRRRPDPRRRAPRSSCSCPQQTLRPAPRTP